MMRCKRFSASVFSLALFGVACPVAALPITDVLFSRDSGSGPTLETVGFDGAEFTGVSTVLAELNPGWTSMSYDAAGFMYFTRIDLGTGPKLEKVGFDGTGFTGASTVLAELNPGWTSMTYDPAAGFMYFMRIDSGAGPKLEKVGFDGTEFTGVSTVLEELNPAWTSMSYDSAAGFMYFTRFDSAAGPTLGKVGFDGTGFIGSATELLNLNPEWSAMSLVYGTETVAVPEPGSFPLLGGGLVLLMFARGKQRLAARAIGCSGSHSYSSSVGLSVG